MYFSTNKNGQEPVHSGSSRSGLFLFCYLWAVDAMLRVSCAAAQGYGVAEDSSSKRFLYKMVTGGFGTFVIIFMGLGGIASIFMTREGDSSKKVPVLGIVMLLIAMITFAYRVMIGAGMMGHEYIEW